MDIAPTVHIEAKTNEWGVSTESEVKIDRLKYHGVDIVLFQMEHKNTNDPNTGYELTVPSGWKEQLDGVVKKDDKVFLEYFPPELNYMKQIPVVGKMVDIWMKDSGIDTFVDIAEQVNEKGATVHTADVASGVMYAYQELAVDIPRWKSEMQKRPIENRVDRTGHQAEIDSAELEIPRAIDARRLMTARALMQEAVSIGGAQPDIIYVGPEAHGKRIKEYIERQTDFESSKGILTKSSEMSEKCPDQEKEKVKIYKSKIGFNNKVRSFEKSKSGNWKLTEKREIF